MDLMSIDETSAATRQPEWNTCTKVYLLGD